MRRLLLFANLVAVALAVSAGSASAVGAGNYAGSTAQKRAVSFHVSGNAVRGFTFQARWRCNNRTGFVTHATFKFIKIRGGHFSAAFATKTRTLATTIKGSFKGRTASGTIRRRARFDKRRKLSRTGKLVCTVDTSFTARRR